jgi:hypothetical protein
LKKEKKEVMQWEAELLKTKDSKEKKLLKFLGIKIDGSACPVKVLKTFSSFGKQYVFAQLALFYSDKLVDRFAAVSVAFRLINQALKPQNGRNYSV